MLRSPQEKYTCEQFEKAMVGKSAWANGDSVINEFFRFPRGRAFFERMDQQHKARQHKSKGIAEWGRMVSDADGRLQAFEQDRLDETAEHLETLTHVLEDFKAMQQFIDKAHQLPELYAVLESNTKGRVASFVFALRSCAFKAWGRYFACQTGSVFFLVAENCSSRLPPIHNLMCGCQTMIYRL